MNDDEKGDAGIAADLAAEVIGDLRKLGGALAKTSLAAGSSGSTIVRACPVEASSATNLPGSTLTCGGSTMIGGCVGDGTGAGVTTVVVPGTGDSVGAATGVGGPPGAGVVTVPGGLTGPDGAGTGGFTCAAAASASAQTAARLVNGARTRRK